MFELCLFSPNGEQGCQANLNAVVSLEMEKAMRLKIEYRANYEQPAPVNPCSHAYNQPDFPGSILQSGQTWVVRTIYELSMPG